MWLRYIFMFLVLAGAASAATVHGTAYNWQLSPQEDVIVEADSTPKQMVVAKDGSYSFNLPKGNYVIKAYYKEDDTLISYAEEKISVKEEGEFVLDLILSEVIEEDLLTEVEGIEIEGFEEEKRAGLAYIIAAVVAALAVIAAAFYLLFRVRKGEEEDEEAAKVLEVVKKAKGRATQKDVRKALPMMSEAKVSLVITDLESRGVIRKIKKGRGNVIILQKK